MSLQNFWISKVVQCLGVTALVLAGSLQAEYEWDEYCCEQCCISNFQIGGNYTRANIKVDDQHSFDGNLGGVQGSYEYRPWNGFYGAVRVAWKEGKTENSHADRRLTYVDAQERIGYTYTSSCYDWSSTLFSGVGYHYLGHKLIQSDDDSLKFDYNEFYIPVGFLSEYIFCSYWALGLNFIWMPQIDSSVEIIPLRGARWILQNRLSNFLVELPLTYFFTEDGCYAVILKPFYEHWEDGHSIARSSSGQSLGLPKNSYNFYGVELNFALLF